MVTSLDMAHAEPMPPSPCKGGSCMQGTDSAQAYYSQPYQPGATYSSRGRGCGIIGPITATL